MTDQEIAEPQRDQVAPGEPTQESPALAAVPDIEHVRGKIGKYRKILDDPKALEEAVGEELERQQMDGKDPTEEEVRANVIENANGWIRKFQGEEQKLVEHWSQLEAAGRVMGKRYAKDVSAEDREVTFDDPKSLELLRERAKGKWIFGTDDLLSNMGSFQKLLKLPADQRPDAISKMAEHMVNDPDAYGIFGGQLGGMVGFLPKGVKKVILEILANEGENSMVKSLQGWREWAEEKARVSSPGEPVAETKKVDRKEEEKKQKARTEANWIRTQAIASLLKSIYPDAAK